jgi:drug/metabolite transporter (DMT)-like permease
MVTYLIPLFAIVVGVAFLSERVAWNEPVGTLVVLLGVAVAQGRLRAAVAALARWRTAPRIAPD